MYCFWEIILKPIFALLQPQNIIEIGSDYGHNTKNILTYCQHHNATLHVVDPIPKYDIDNWQKEYGELVVFYLSLSLDAIPQIEKFDLVLIDGDHNWYTVFHELKLLEKLCQERGQAFPLVILHDIGWPYGRRDLYYDPDTIPTMYQQPYAQKGMQLGSINLLEEGGLNSHLNNSIAENNSRNGVLTAVEDFLQETELSLDLIKIPGLHGLGILVPCHLQTNRELIDFLETFKLSPVIEQFIKQLETARLDLVIKQQASKATQQKIESTYQAEIAQLKASHQSQLNYLKKQIEQLQSQLITQDKIENWQGEADLFNWIEQFDSLITSMLNSNRWKIGNFFYKFSRKLLFKSLDPPPQEHQIKLLVNFKTWREKFKNADNNLEKYRCLENLANLVEQFDSLATSIIDSNRWKVGNLLYTMQKKLLLQPLDPPPQERQEKLIKNFQQWSRKFRTKTTKNTTKLSAQKYNVNNFLLIKNRYKFPQQSPLKYLANTSLKVDIVVCVHNALDDVKLCLDSVEKNTFRQYNLVIINDGSNQATTQYLRQFAEQRQHCVLIENSAAQGYTKAANQGLQASQGDYVVLLNSDTIVSRLWLERLLECAESESNIGIVGPLSNAASWQSVPELFDEQGGWAINSLPEGCSIDDWAEIVNLVSQKLFPRVPFINGFCFLIKRSLIEKIGYLDEVSFPKGYGEENDYCLRAANAGFELAIADHAYVYHAKSKSYGHQQRKLLAQAGGKALQSKHGKGLVNSLIKDMRNNSNLLSISRAIKLYLENNSDSVSSLLTFNILFLLPVRAGGGGVHSVIQEVVGMRNMGVNAQVAIREKHLYNYRTNYYELIENDDLFFCYKDIDNLIDYAAKFQVVVATINTSTELLHKIVQSNSAIMPAYYIQDYEPWFYEKGSKDWQVANNSYQLIPGTVLFAKTQWICETIQAQHNLKVHKVEPSIDHSLYYPKFEQGQNQRSIISLTAMIRPSTPRRGAERTMRILKKLKLQLQEKLQINIFGCSQQDLEINDLTRDFEFNNYGVLIREQVAELLRSSNIFIDLSDYQAFGRTGLEAMACGCAVIVPDKGGAHEYAINNENSIIVDTSSEEICYEKINQIINNEELREKIRQNAIITASEYSIYQASLSELMLLHSQWSSLSAKLPQKIATKEKQIVGKNIYIDENMKNINFAENFPV